MEVINLSKENTVLNRFMAEIRDVDIQKDSMRFRRNIERIGEIMAYEISKRLEYKSIEVQSPLGTAITNVPSDKIVIGTILRAGLIFHHGFLKCFDGAENAFVSAYRMLKENKSSVDVHIEYIASPRLEDKVLILTDPMLATGSSMELSYKALLTKGMPKHIHIATVVASDQAIEYCKNCFPADRTTIWTTAIDESLDDHSYIVPGLGDVGDLAYGVKE